MKIFPVPIVVVATLFVLPFAAHAQGETCIQLGSDFEDILGISGAPVIRILGIKPGSPAGILAEEEFWKTGDLILGFNDKKVIDFPDADSFVNDLRFEAATGAATYVEILEYDPILKKYNPEPSYVKLEIYPEKGEKRIGIAWAWSYRVENVSPGSPAYKMGVRSGDFILDIAGRNVSSLRGPIDLDEITIRSAANTKPKISLTVIQWEPQEDGRMKGIPRFLEGTIPQEKGRRNACK